MKKALIFEGRVVDVSVNEFPVHQSMMWIDCPENVQAGSWKYENGNFIPPADPSYTDLRRAEYPNFLDYIDGVVKGDQSQIQAYIDACLAVKEKYPKP